MLKCVYIIPHAGNLEKGKKNTNGGSSSHIELGIQHLGIHFEVTPYVLRAAKDVNEDSPSTKSNGTIGKKIDYNRLKGLLRDIKLIFQNHLHFFKHYRSVKNIRPDFIYERSEYLNFNGIIISKLLRIPLFYEGNWVHYLGIKQFYRSYFNKIAKSLEEWMYNSATHSFFIGNQNKYLKLKSGKWSIVQNGVGIEIIERFAQHQNYISGDKVKICVLANLMPHHRFDILADALKAMDEKYQKSIELHLIGFHFEHVTHLIPSAVTYIYHGPKRMDDIYILFKEMNVAVISGGPQYSSFMKLYDYAAAKLMVICPDLENIVANFTGQEILYFSNEDSLSLMQSINYAIDTPLAIGDFGTNLYSKVKNKFTWEKIFRDISDKINESILLKNP